MVRNLREGKNQESVSAREEFLSHSGCFPDVHLLGYVEGTAVGLRMEPAAAEGFPQDGIVRFLQTLEKCGVSNIVEG